MYGRNSDIFSVLLRRRPILLRCFPSPPFEPLQSRDLLRVSHLSSSQRLRQPSSITPAYFFDDLRQLQLSYSIIKMEREQNHDNDKKESANDVSGCVLENVKDLENFVYRQDVVGRKKHDKKLGVVLEVAGEIDSEGSITDESESDDDEDVGRSNAEAGNNYSDYGSDNEETNILLSDGQVRVVWADGNETTENIGDVRVVDRAFVHGDIVALASDPTGQLGLVVDVSVTVDLQAENGEVIKNVSSRDLKHIREFSVGDYVVYGPWLGRVDDVLDNVTVMFDDGSICKVVKADPLRLKPLSNATIDNVDSPYYPGQRVKATSSSVFKTSRWLTGLWKSNRLEGTVINVQPGSVTVYWIASALGLHSNSSSVPAEEQNPKNLTLLSCFSYANWQLGDWCLLLNLPSSSVSEDISMNNQKHRSKKCKSRSGYSIGERKNSNAAQFIEENGSSKPLFVQETRQREIDKLGDSISAEDNAVQLASGHVEDGFLGNNQISEGLKDFSCSCSSIAKESGKITEKCQTESSMALPESGSCSCSSTAKESANESWPYRKKLRKVIFKMDKKTHKKEEDFEKALCIINTMTKVDVAWQDGRRECGVDSKRLIPIQTPNDQDFFPEQYVVEKVTNDGDESLEAKRIGVVRSVNAKDRTVCVRWLKPVSSPEDPREFDNDEIVSAYELDQHPDYDYCYGDVVVRLSPITDTINHRTPKREQVENADAIVAAKDVSNNSKVSEAEQKYEDESRDFKSLSWVGNITGLHDGDIEVTWADGMVSMVGPQAIFVVGRDDDEESFLGDSDDAASWETVDEDQMDSLNPEEEADLSNPTENTGEEENITSVSDEETDMQSGPLSMPSAVLDFLGRLASGFLSIGKKQPDHLDSNDAVLNGTESQDISKFPENEASNNILSMGKADNADEQLQENGDEAVSGENHVSVKHSVFEKVVSGMPLETSDNLRTSHESRERKFKHFDSTENPLDHHFLSEGEQTSGGRKWVKKVQQEWSILKKNLPDDIFVRVFEDRMDLLRAVIIGAPGTPYQDGLFLFDFQLPSDYPHVPPSAYYHSGGLRVNPNLYVEGKVCLSLLNTWAGKGNEVWDPSSSSILQVLVSLQGLVLNSKPYFNEAGYEKQVGTIEGEKNSLIYNENTYLLNLKSMMYLLRRPPMHFEEFIKDHFRRRGPYILKACAAYMNGCSIGSLTKDACETEKSREQPSSVGFKLMLGKILPRLVSALSGIGVDCQQYEHLLKT